MNVEFWYQTGGIDVSLPFPSSQFYFVEITSFNN